MIALTELRIFDGIDLAYDLIIPTEIRPITSTTVVYSILTHYLCLFTVLKYKLGISIQCISKSKILRQIVSM